MKSSRFQERSITWKKCSISKILQGFNHQKWLDKIWYLLHPKLQQCTARSQHSLGVSNDPFSFFLKSSEIEERLSGTSYQLTTKELRSFCSSTLTHRLRKTNVEREFQISINCLPTRSTDLLTYLFTRQVYQY